MNRPLTYPEARVDDVEDTLGGVSFPDPFRWLEESSEKVREWQQTQAELASSQVREWPHFDRLRELVARFSSERYVSLPCYANGRWFRMHGAEGAAQAQAVVANEPMGEGRVLFDPMKESLDRPPFLSWIAPSPDGRILALGLCVDGSESNTIRLIDVASGTRLPDPPPQTLMDNWTGGVQWLPDSSGFFFTAITGSAVDFVQRVYLHRRAPNPVTEPVDIAWTASKEWRMVVISRDGRYAVALDRIRNPIPVAIATLGTASLCWRPFVTSIEGTLAGHVVGDRYIAVTDVGAPRGRLVAIALDAEDPNDCTNWQELVGESNAVLRTVTPVGNVLYLTQFADTYSHIRVCDLDGKELSTVPLPARSAVNELPFPLMNLARKSHPERFIFAFSSLTVSPGIYSHTPSQRGIETLRAPKTQLENAVIEDRWAVSVDGVRVPYHIVRHQYVNAGQPQPTLIYAYGGYNSALLPQFPGAMAAFVAAGGVFVHAHLRGGGELGRDWWQGGRMRNKENCYHDLYAIAEDLIAAQRATPQTLAVTGASNGGLLAGVAVTQRPDLWKVVVPRVPMLDLVGACREQYGRLCVTMEFADVEDSEEVRRLAAFSPYHLVRDGVRYPAVFIEAGDTDPRCSPWHARKFAARMQQATSGTAPILLRVWENVGHGWATDKNTALIQNTEWLAFTLRQLGVEQLPA